MPAFCLNVIREYYLVALRVGGWGGGGDVKELLGFFINHAFVGVFLYDSGTPKHALLAPQSGALRISAYRDFQSNPYPIHF